MSKLDYLKEVLGKDYKNRLQELDFSNPGLKETFKAHISTLDSMPGNDQWVQKEFIESLLSDKKGNKPEFYVNLLVKEDKYHEWLKSKILPPKEKEEKKEMPKQEKPVAIGTTVTESDTKEDIVVIIPRQEVITKPLGVSKDVPVIPVQNVMADPEVKVEALPEICQMHPVLKWTLQAFIRSLDDMEKVGKTTWATETMKKGKLAEARKYSMQVKSMIEEWRRYNGYDQSNEGV